MLADLRQEIDTVMAVSEAKWNEGDLDGYLKVYREDSSTAVVADGRIYKGAAEIRQLYSTRYASEGSMGQFKITVLELKTLGASYALATARCEITQEAGSYAYLATIVLCRTVSGWLFDHVTASA